MSIYVDQELVEEDQDHLDSSLLWVNVIAVSIHTCMFILPKSGIETLFISFCINVNSHAQELVCYIEPYVCQSIIWSWAGPKNLTQQTGKRAEGGECLPGPLLAYNWRPSELRLCSYWCFSQQHRGPLLVNFVQQFFEQQPLQWPDNWSESIIFLVLWWLFLSHTSFSSTLFMIS